MALGAPWKTKVSLYLEVAFGSESAVAHSTFAFQTAFWALSQMGPRKKIGRMFHLAWQVICHCGSMQTNKMVHCPKKRDSRANPLIETASLSS